MNRFVIIVIVPTRATIISVGDVEADMSAGLSLEDLAEHIAPMQRIEDNLELAEDFARVIEARKMSAIDKIEYTPMLEPDKEPPPEYRPKLQRYDKRRNFAAKPYWNRIRSNPKLR